MFHRTTRHVSLTDLGERFFIHCRASITEALAAQEVIDMASAAPRGLVRISCPVLATQVFLAPNLPAFMILYPQVRVQVLATDRTVDLPAESVDIAVRLRRPEDMDPDLVAKPLGISRRILVASPDYLHRTGSLSHPDALAPRPTFYYEAADEPQPQWLLVGPDGARTTAKLRPTLMCRGHETILNAAIQGLGIAMIQKGLSHNAPPGVVLREVPWLTFTTPPKELMKAMPAAAAAPVRNKLGRGQKVGSAAQMPMVQMVIATMAAKGEFRYRATGMAMPPKAVGAATCQIRSPVLSPCLAQKYIEKAPKTNGMATMKPCCITVKSVLNCSAKPATMVGRKKLIA